MEYPGEVRGDAKLNVLIRHLVALFPQAAILSRQIGDTYHLFVIVPYGVAQKRRSSSKGRCSSSGTPLSMNLVPSWIVSTWPRSSRGMIGTSSVTRVGPRPRQSEPLQESWGETKTPRCERPSNEG